MKTEDITIEGMHCASCEKNITRALAKQGVTVTSIAHNTGKALVKHEGIPREAMRQALRARGYDLADDAKERKEKSPRKAAREIPIETTVLTNGFLTLTVLLIVQTLLIYGIYSKVGDYKQQYFMPLIYLPIVIVTNIVALWHQRAYARNTSCMTGMMVGMTLGMMTGFGIGAIVGLTNGMFTGSIVGMIVGIIAGVYAGNCCGTMGIMEGMMAGLMGGTMGAMLTVMMVVDHVEWFLPILILTDTIILGFMMRMIYEEYHDAHDGAKDGLRPWPFTAVLAAGFIIMALISAIIIFTPKGIY
ncbi:TPA: hypothetical protein HA251_07335 [Candidatus Woesearchaeota archaeon]|nr:hypothetical protein [Candidatus Woesearchaeota archaeon]